MNTGFVKKGNSVEDQVLELIRLEPGIKSTDIYSLLDQYSSNNVSGRVTTLFQSGKIVRKEHKTDNNQRTYRYWLRKDAPTGAEGFKPKMKMKTPTETGFAARIAALEDAVRELEQWKNDALARYPDLGVEPIVLRARKIAAKASPDYAKLFLAGSKDTTPMMKAILAALEEGL